jgi:hypothetical protein
MKRWKTSVLVAGAILGMLIGCRPEKRVAWSPDGQWAAVRAGDGLRLCDPGGTLSPPVAGEFTAALWLPNSRELLAVQALEFGTWSELAEQLPADEVDRIVEWSDRTERELLAHEGDVDDFEPSAVSALTWDELAALILHVRDNATEEARRRLGDQMDDLADATAQVYVLQHFRVADGRLDAGAERYRSIVKPEPVDVTSDGAVLALVMPSAGDAAARRLYVMSLGAGAPPRRVASATSSQATFGPDDRTLVYAQARPAPQPGADTMSLGVIARTRVRADDGTLLDEFAGPEDLAGIIFYPDTPVHCLSDGRIVFASLELTLPVSAKDMPERPSLFAIDPDRSPIVARLLTRQTAEQLGAGLLDVAISPDEEHIAVLTDDGVVVVVTLATGARWAVLEAEQGEDARILPVWRTANELCVSRKSAEDGRPHADLVLLKLDWENEKIERWLLTRDWPESAIAGFLDGDAQSSDE